ncbi:MAG: NAD(P)-dependent alcohol dehydrogenase [Gammaproteobacteria bacterium]|nr:NAD(P)-dependent alcohol dehydrogenase [Gammaproteobacteria bacterium]MCW5583142.1 NAD(P)-dependent alcohol dehydrogenase [Gammaproteobacteria bacterium]
MHPTKSYAAAAANDPLNPYIIQRREPGEYDVVIDIQYCGVCHSDVHQVRNEWGNSTFPMVPGHEIIGKVVKIGSSVSRYKVGDIVGVGCFVDSCCECHPCQEGLQQYCENGANLTYNGVERDGKTPTFGGYSTQIVVNEKYVLAIPSNLPLDQAAPLLCAGITTYSPLRQWKVKPGDKVGIIGLGGLGHMAVKLASAMGAEVTVLSTSNKKKEDAIRFGAKHFINTKDSKTFVDYVNYFDFMINTAAGNIDLSQYLPLLKLDKTMVCVGAPEHPSTLNVFPLIMKRRRLAGSLVGGIPETQEMLNFCGEHNITAEIELITIDKINEAYERMIKSDVRYRFVIDINSLR